MEQIYHFTNWASASRMKNILNPCLIIDIGIIRDTENETILGYQLTVIDNSINKVVYKYYIDYGAEGTWSLSTAEAITMLNQVGFPCEFSTEEFKISNEVREILINLKGLGYTCISRSIRPANIFVYDPAQNNTPRTLSRITTYNYHDFWGIPEIPTNIDHILGD